MNIIIHTTKEQVAFLMTILGKLGYDEKGEQTLTVPA